MLLFIIIPASFAPRFVNFNTSHVTVYHKGTQLRKEQTKNFNTSHVTVYQSGSPYLSTVPRFQYISCYCLSDSHCMSLETQWYFNTSHVTVYLCISIPECVYIRISIHLMLLFIRDIIKQAKKFGIFQYISCYCLSLQGKLLQFV